MIRIGVTGGIGSGKSTLCKLLEGFGAPVYYSDERARAIMNCDVFGCGAEEGGAPGDGAFGREGDCRGVDVGCVRDRIVALLGEDAYGNGVLDRAYVASKVFADNTLLASLNAIVHPAVAMDFEAWALLLADRPYVVLESAVLFESGFDRLVDHVVTVSASAEVRVGRAMSRDGLERRDVESRMDNQLSDAEREAHAWLIIRNDGGLAALANDAQMLDRRLRDLSYVCRAGVTAVCETTEKQSPIYESKDEMQQCNMLKNS